MSEEQELLPGMLVGRYQLLFRLGKGGMGEVWAAAQSVSSLGFQKLIALKVLRTAEMTSNAAVMFLDEAKAASALQHAAIVSTVDLGRDDDILFLAMDMVRGPSLTALLQRLVINKHTMSPAIVAYIGTQIASALDYAHDRATFEGRQLELIHRDVSPHNVLLDLNGAVRLTDFGVARTTIQSHESHVGTVRGKPSYMAPEQVVGGDIDARTDLFSLGIVLYESASLKRLFGRSNPVKSMDAVLKHQPKPLTELVPGFPEPLWRVIETALEKDPDKRYQRAADFAEALERVGRTLDGSTSATRDLCALIRENFPGDAFEIDGRVQEVISTSAPSLPPAVVSSDEIRVGPAPATSESVTRAMRARGSSGSRPAVAARAGSGVRAISGSGSGSFAARPASGPAAPVSISASDFRAGGGTGTHSAWPSAPGPDPLSPEAIEEARTRFAPARTPVAMPAMEMSSVPSMEAMTAYSAQTGQSFVAVMPPRRSSMGMVLAALCAAAVLLLGAAFVVVSNKKEAPAYTELNDGTGAPTQPVGTPIEVPGAVRAQSAQKAQPVKTVEPPAEKQAADEAAAPEEAPVRLAKQRAKQVPVRTPVTEPATEQQKLMRTTATNSVGPADGNATRAQVLDLIRQVKKIDPDAAKQMYPTLNEAGDDNVKVLNELRAKAKAILASH